MDWHLLLMVLVFVLVDVIILTPVSILESSRLAPCRVPDVEHAPSVNVRNNTLIIRLCMISVWDA